MLKEIQEVEELRGTIRRSRTTFGIGRIIGYLIIISYFTILPQTLKLIWPWLLTNFTEIEIYVGSIFVLNIGIFIIYNTTLSIIYTLEHPFFQQYKNTSKPWPWHQNKQQWQKLKKKSFGFIVINFFIVTPIMVYITLQTSLPYNFSLESWPNQTQLISQFMLFLIVEDILFYWAHRLLHQPSWYWIHKHHHEYRQTIGLAAHYVHPIEYVIAGTIPSAMGFQILCIFYPVHYCTILVWLIYRIIQSYEGHCGYQWSWNTLSLLPFTAGSDYHDFHHAANIGNYGSVFMFLDVLCGTQKQFIKSLSLQAKSRQKSS